MENNKFSIHHKDGNMYTYVWKYERIDNNTIKLIVYESDGIPTFYICSKTNGVLIVRYDKEVLNLDTLFGQNVYSIASTLL